MGVGAESGEGGLNCPQLSTDATSSQFSRRGARRGGMTSAFIYSFREMRRGSEGSDGRRKRRRGLSNGEDTSNTSKKGERQRRAGWRGREGEKERDSLHVLLSMCLVNLGRNA